MSRNTNAVLEDVAERLVVATEQRSKELETKGEAHAREAKQARERVYDMGIRRANYRPDKWGCPACWLNEGRIMQLTTDRLRSRFRCVGCGEEFGDDVPAGGRPN